MTQRFLLCGLAFVLLLAALPAGASVRVVTTTSDLASITRAVGGDRVEVESILDGRRDPHFVEVLPSYMLKLRKADLFVQIGLDLELWAPAIVAGARSRDLRVVDVSHGVEILEKPEGPITADRGDIHAGGNPHYWLDPANVIRIACTIHDALVTEDPEGAAVYARGLETFTAELEAAMKRWRERMAPYAGTRVIAFHNSWPYFNRAFGLEAAGFVEPKPGVSPSGSHTAEIIARIRREKIPAVIIAPYYDPRASERIAREGGARLVVLATSVGGIDGADDMIQLFERNLDRLIEALEAGR